ncbi:hypothetical protein JXB12_02135 [candidate division KSB1 bacterium]|nr:hypothetical protein [candidate division KSB1 bacterium]
MVSLKLKKKYDKFSTRGIIYVLIASILMGYELLTAEKIRFLIVFGYSVTIVIGVICLLFIEEKD